MRRFIKTAFLLVILTAFSAQTCGGEEVEQSAIDDAESKSAIRGQEAAAEDWKKFMEVASRQIAIAENQLKTLHARQLLNEGVERGMLHAEEVRSSKLLKNLKALLEEQDSKQPASSQYSIEMTNSNTLFKNFFLHEIIELNNHLEDFLDKE